MSVAKEVFYYGKNNIWTNRRYIHHTGRLLSAQSDLPPEEERHIGVWAQRRLRYLKQHHKILYCNLLTSGKIHSHLTDVEQEAQTLFLRLVKEYAEQEGLTEQMKAENQMEWVQRMNNIRERVNEVVNTEMIFT